MITLNYSVGASKFILLVQAESQIPSCCLSPSWCKLNHLLEQRKITLFIWCLQNQPLELV
jgi:hypothetical protein